MNYFRYVRKVVGKYPLLSALLSVIFLLFFVPGLMTAASTFQNVLGILIGFTSGLSLFYVITHLFDSMGGEHYD
jgi:hypothetical protein